MIIAFVIARHDVPPVFRCLPNCWINKCFYGWWVMSLLLGIVLSSWQIGELLRTTNESIEFHILAFSSRKGVAQLGNRYLNPSVARGSLLVPHEDINAALRVLYTTAAMGKTGSCELAPPAWHCRVWFHAGAAATSVLVALTCCVSRSLEMWQMSEGKGYYLNCHCFNAYFWILSLSATILTSASFEIFDRPGEVSFCFGRLSKVLFPDKFHHVSSCSYILHCLGCLCSRRGGAS